MTVDLLAADREFGSTSLISAAPQRVCASQFDETVGDKGRNPHNVAKIPARWVPGSSLSAVVCSAKQELRGAQTLTTIETGQESLTSVTETNDPIENQLPGPRRPGSNR
ncbi:MAG: hypothetical protein QGG09_01080 [Pirellulaceae bacterium]|nr:hypothetical protein [Pirellulaceae bacterium]